MGPRKKEVLRRHEELWEGDDGGICSVLQSKDPSKESLQGIELNKIEFTMERNELLAVIADALEKIVEKL